MLLQNLVFLLLWSVSNTTHLDPCHRLDGLFVLSDRSHVRLLLEERRVVVDVQHVHADPSRRFLPAAVSRQHGERVTAHELVVQAGLQSNPARLLVY